MGQFKRIAGDHSVILCLNFSRIRLRVSTFVTRAHLVVLCTPQLFVPKERDPSYLKGRKMGGC